MNKNLIIDDSVKSFCIDFGLPALVLTICAVLIFAGFNGEVKTLFAGAVGWIFKSGYTQRKRKQPTNDAPQSKSDS